MLRLMMVTLMDVAFLEETLHVVVMKHSSLFQLKRLILQYSSDLIILSLKNIQALSINYRIKHQVLGMAFLTVVLQNQTPSPSSLNSDYSRRHPPSFPSLLNPGLQVLVLQTCKSPGLTSDSMPLLISVLSPQMPFPLSPLHLPELHIV